MRRTKPPANDPPQDLHAHCTCVAFLQDDIAALKRQLARRGMPQVSIGQTTSATDAAYLASLPAPDRAYMARKLGVKAK